MQRLLIIIALTGIFTATSVVSAPQLRQYSAEIENSVWQLSKNTPLECQLQHEIPRFGQAVFRSVASKGLNMAFELQMLRLPDNYALAEVLSIPPAWRAGEPSKAIANMQLLKQYNGELPKESAWTLLTELEHGFSPSFYFNDWYSPHDKVVAALNPVQFATQFTKFNQCISALLPYSFEDIAFTVLNYESGSDQLSRESSRRLQQIAEYLKYDNDIDYIEIQGYSDSYGGLWMNEQLSIKRAEKVKTFFVSVGLSADKVQVTGFGERRHIAPNQIAIERKKNRRVVLQLSKP
ncbi:flagellar protein MotY [Rheinheimera sp. MMS21-TC3]|uniref:flagellar protein MotY n=1 Tax=Rheinheimera sp. MMS21-TC3 TaxID=3072790 RepID=UPI0028C37CCC|nr:OmpA family protein [Rheinheimera sp. MMS21-TC3]WNO60022.1 OmpA family protein [Rheinheimera sp. MMS21-TC3]